MKKPLLALGALLACVVAMAQVQIPQVQQINSNDLFEDIPQGNVHAGNQYAPAALLGTYSQTLAGGNAENALIGGDFTTGQNLWQRGVTGAATTTAVIYGADRWAGLSGTSTTFTQSQQTGAADVPSAYGASNRVARTGSGVVLTCVGQEVPTAGSYRFQNQTAEFDFHALAGSGFSPASDNITATISYGTGTDEGASALFYTATGGTIGATGFANGVAFSQTVPISTVWSRYSIVAPIPATATEIGVTLCFKPVGSSPSSDYFEFAGAQLVPNSSLSGVAGTAGALLNINDARAKSFVRRPVNQEATLQLAYYWEQDEAASDLTTYGWCQGGAAATAGAQCVMQFPVKMRAVPTLSYTAGTIAATVGTSGAANAVSALSITKASTYQANLAATVTSVAAITGFLEGGNSTGGGKIKFSAEL